MILEINWGKPLLVAARGRLIRDDEESHDRIPEGSGVYFFARKFGSKVQPFYVGKSLNIRRRFNQHLKDSNIVDALRGHYDASQYIPQGARYFHFGELKTRGRQNVNSSLNMIEKYLIQQVLTQPFELLNIRLRETKAHQLSFSGESGGSGPYQATSIPA